MFRSAVVAAVIHLAACALPASAQPEGSSAAEAEVRRLSAAEVQAFLQRAPEAVEPLWSDEFVVTNPLNQFATKQQVLGMMRSGVLVITKFDRQIEYLRVYDNIVILAGRETVTWGGKMPNAGRTERLRITAVYMRQADGRWRQIARHANVVPEA